MSCKKEKIVELRSVSFSYDYRDVLEHVNLAVTRNEFLGIIGPNGSGKTTLLKLISKLLSPKTGIIMLDGENLKKLTPTEIARKIALVLAEFPETFDLTVVDVVLSGRYPYQTSRFSYWDRKEDIVTVSKAIELADLKGFSNRRLAQLSSGEKQRVMIAKALAQEPKVLLIDEPTSHLDLKYQVEIMKLLRDLTKKEGITVIATIHDLNLAGRYCDRLVLLSKGKIVKIGSPEQVLTPSLIREVYGINVVIKWEKNPRSPIIIPI